MSIGYNRRLVCCGLWLAGLGMGAIIPARAEIVMSGRDANGAIDNSGTNKNPVPFSLGQYIGDFGGFLGTPISPHYFVTANHIGNAGSGQFNFANGTSTSTTYGVTLAGVQDDLAIWKINGAGAFSVYAPLYFQSNETNQALVSVGNGTTRGGAITNNGPLVGWFDGAGGTYHSWQTNTVDMVVNGQDIGAPGGFGGDFLTFDFNREVDAQGNLLNPDEGIFSGGDSGGPTFVFDPTTHVYELAGINSLVDAVSSTPNGPAFPAALFDARGFYGGPDVISDPMPVPLSSYATRISSRQDFILQTLGSDLPITQVPEPGAWVLLAVLGCTSATFARRARRQKGISPI